LNGNISGVLFTGQTQQEAYSVLTEIFRYAPARASHLLIMGQRAGGITDNGVTVTMPRDLHCWTIKKEH